MEWPIVHESFEGEKAILVEYHEKHVPKCHEWEKRRANATGKSYALTLDQEFEFQEFIFSVSRDNGISMVGEVTLVKHTKWHSLGAEIQFMIPELCSQCCGEGVQEEAVILMMHYAVKSLSFQSFCVKIRKSNSNVFNLFIKLGFKEVSASKTKVTLKLLGEDLRCKELLREVSKTVKYGYSLMCARSFLSEEFKREYQGCKSKFRKKELRKEKLRTAKKTEKEKRVASERCTRSLLALKGELRTPKKTLKKRKSVASKRCNGCKEERMKRANVESVGEQCLY
ncbi:hypothetical protein GIB67_000841 [Kingdonia uniflora]|uniref:N-acetyltransferase domain-containing protein n=1 Tax=Kingdonia uniflora TaxID=39325 RepID=A0A7J7NRM3_9MAGN|nr:hypothetical protein GIB67_000841 [Kingdonia uniflora]